MGSFTKVYARTFKPNEKLTLTWDPGYRNVKIYDEKRLVMSWEQPGQFVKGVSFQDEQLGEIRLKFTDSRPLQLELKVNNKKYTPNKGGKQEIDLTGQTSIFWVMLAFTLVGSAIIIAKIELAYGSPGINTTFLMIIAIVNGIYLFTALMMTLKKYWAFFIGYGYMLISTILLMLVVLGFGIDVLLFVMLFFRTLLLIYLSISIRKVLYLLRVKREKNTLELIDETLQ